MYFLVTLVLLLDNLECMWNSVSCCQLLLVNKYSSDTLAILQSVCVGGVANHFPLKQFRWGCYGSDGQDRQGISYKWNLYKVCKIRIVELVYTDWDDQLYFLQLKHLDWTWNLMASSKLKLSHLESNFDAVKGRW